MLAQILEQKGLTAPAFSSVGFALNECFEAMQAGANDVVCISALPPYAFAPAQAMWRKIRERFPNLTVIVCVWGFNGVKASGLRNRNQIAGLSSGDPRVGGNAQAIIIIREITLTVKDARQAA